MATKIIIKNSAVEGKVPDGTAIDAAELAINLKDQKLYSKDADGNVFELGNSNINNGGTDDKPDGPEIGDLYFDTDLEILLVWNGTDWEQVILGGDSVWVKDGNNIRPADPLNDVQIGGTAADPKISLNASDGSAEFAGPVKSGGDPSNGANNGTHIKPGGRLLVSNSIESARIFEGYLTGTSTPTISFYPTGSAEFAGDVIAGDYDNSEGVKVFASGWVNLKQPDGTSNSSVNLRTNIGSTRTSEITADGSRYIGGTGTTANIKLKADGSATFTGNVDIGNPADAAGYGVRLKPGAGNDPQLYVRTQGSAGQPAVQITNGTTDTVKVFGDGSAEFAAAVQVGGDPDNAVLLQDLNFVQWVVFDLP